MRCRSKCQTYETNKGYMCDLKLKGTSYTKNKDWCYINNDDVKTFNNPDLLDNKLDKPNSGIYGYWDTIKEINRRKMCTNGYKITYNSCLSLIDFLKNCLGGLIMLLLTMSAVSGEHLYETYMLGHSTDKQILLYFINLLKNIAEEKFGKLNEDLNTIITELTNDVNIIDENDKTAYGKYLRDIFQKSLDNNLKENNQISTDVIKFFIDNIPDEHKMEVLKGANFIRIDNGEMYNYTKNNLNGIARISSHESDDSQYGYTNLFGGSYLHMLCGKYTKNNISTSWCQFEGAPMPPGLSFTEIGLNIFNGWTVNRIYLKHFLDHTMDTGYYGIMSKIPILAAQSINDLIEKSPKDIKTLLSLHNVTVPNGVNIGKGTSVFTDAHQLDLSSFPLFPPNDQHSVVSNQTFPYNVELTQINEALVRVFQVNEEDLDTISNNSVRLDLFKNNITNKLGYHNEQLSENQINNNDVLSRVPQLPYSSSNLLGHQRGLLSDLQPLSLGTGSLGTGSMGMGSLGMGGKVHKRNTKRRKNKKNTKKRKSKRNTKRKKYTKK